MIKLIKVMHKPFFFHLSTSYTKNGDVYLLNYASKDINIKKQSRSILSREIEELSRYYPNGFIVHSPTALDFSINRKIIGSPISLQNCSESFKWLDKLSENIYIENSPEAININNRSYFTKPINNIKAKKYNIKLLLDTGHFYTNCLTYGKKFSAEVTSTFLNNFIYFHISTLNKKASYDTHGSVFLSSKQNLPSSKQLREIVSKIQKNEIINCLNYYIVCEPSGGSKIHIGNLIKLLELSNTRH